MNELLRIEQALAENDLDPDLFERCAQDLLGQDFPGLSALPGGGDWGRDADLPAAAVGEVPMRLMVTKSREKSHIRANMVDGLTSMKEHAVPYDRIIIANPGLLSETERAKLRKTAQENGARLDLIYDRTYFASRLRRDVEWRQRLLGLSGDPISVSRVPWRLAESPWFQLPLVGRAEEMDLLAGAPGDVIVVGSPGTGKTRMLAELSDVVFVDPDAAPDRLAEDVRWLNPRLVALDDVMQRPELVGLIQRLRRQESDWMSIRLAVVCWPDELEEVRALVPGAQVVKLDLLERADIDTLVQSMGVTGVVARHMILDQAEGHPGWAIPLADLLLQTGWEPVATGAGLLGEVDQYLRRARLPAGARDLLAVTAALGGLDETDLANLAEEVGLSRPDAGRLLRTVAQGGLLDVSRTSTTAGTVRRYTVRPRMLAAALAAEHYFLGDVPLNDPDRLYRRWPEHWNDITLMACVSAHLGAEAARTLAADLFEQTADRFRAGSVGPPLLESYALIDQQFARQVVGLLAEAAQTSGSDADSHQDASRTGEARLASLIAREYLLPDAVRLLLDMSLHDTRDTNPHPDHPLRQLADLCEQAHPDLPPTAEHRRLVSQVLAQWMPVEPTARHQRVWTAVTPAILTPHVRGGYLAPENQRQFTMIETILSPEYANIVREELWAVALGHVRADSAAAAGLVPTVEDWLRVGSGHDHPFGADHDKDAVRAAAEVGQAMFDDLLGLAGSRTGLAARLLDTAARFDLTVPHDLAADTGRSPFHRRLSREDRLNGEGLRTEIAAEISAWREEPAANVVARLAALKADVAIAGTGWPSRVWIACRVLAEAVDDPSPWVRELLDQGLLPEGTPFIEKLVSRSWPDDQDLVLTCLGNPQSRKATLHLLLASSTDDDLIDLAVSDLGADDFSLLEVLAARHETPIPLTQKILNEASPEGRAAMAIALSIDIERLDQLQPEIIEDWRHALLHVRPPNLGHTAAAYFGRLVDILAEQAPELIEKLILDKLGDRGPGWYSSLGYNFWSKVHRLPVTSKNALLEAVPDEPDRVFLIGRLIGADGDWLADLISRGVLRPDMALALVASSRAIPIERLASILVPLGIDPARIAVIAHSGTWIGDESARYESIIKTFSQYAESPNPSIQAVGEAGCQIFNNARQQALDEERHRRIRGG
jgi:hypothetical protein